MEPIRLLRELIALPSVNPAFLAGGGEQLAGEGRVAEYLERNARRLGLGVRRQRVFPGRDNLLLSLDPAGKSRHRLVLAPHLDTVGASAEQLRPTVRGSRLYGRGACDTKGSVAVMFSALAGLARNGRRPPHTEILFAGLVDEENAQTGSRVLARSGLRADLAIVGEPTCLKVVTAHKGNVWLRLETQGKAAHGARPELGRNAVLEMARVVQLLETEYAATLRHQRHPLLGAATINVGTIHGGRQTNIVPDICQITADRRTLPGESATGVCREVRALLRLHGLRATVADSKGERCWPMATDPDRPWVRQLMNQAGQREPQGVHYFCDASVLSQGGIPSVVFGPGDIAQAHTAAEWIAIKQVRTATDMLSNYLRSLP